MADRYGGPSRWRPFAMTDLRYGGPQSVRLAVQNFTSIGAEGWECGLQNIKNLHFFGKDSSHTPLTDFEHF